MSRRNAILRTLNRVTSDPGTPSHASSEASRALGQRRRKLIWSSVAVSVLLVGAAIGLIALYFSPDHQAWGDESRVFHTHGIVIDEVRSSGACKGADFDTQLEWTQDGESRTGWTRTCRSGPDVGDRVDMWIRDDGKIVLTEPSTTNVLIVFGILLLLGMGAMSFFSLRANLRLVNSQLHSR